MALFACDCAEQALNMLNPDDVDPRSIEAIRVARLYVVGEATKEELDRAARAAEAAREWQTKRLMQYLNGEL